MPKHLCLLAEKTSNCGMKPECPKIFLYIDISWIHLIEKYICGMVGTFHFKDLLLITVNFFFLLFFY